MVESDRADAGEADREHEQMLHYVKKIARKVRRQYGKEVSEEDLVSFGVIGYLEAASRFDKDRGITLRQYVYRRTYGAMIDGVRRWTLHRHVWATRKRAEQRAKAVLHAAPSNGGRSIEEGPQFELATQATLQVDHLRAMDRELGSSCEPFFAGVCGRQANEGTAVEEVISVKRRWERMLRASDDLDTRERVLLSLYYGEGHSMSEVAERFGCTKSWVCRMHGRAIEKIRKWLDKERAEAVDGSASTGHQRCRSQGRSREPVGASQLSSPPSVSSASSGVQAEQDGKN